MITENSKVKVHYTGRFSDGEVFDSSMIVEGNENFKEKRDPIEVELGKGMVIPGFEKALQGMNEGDTKTVTIPCEEAYGPVEDDRLQEVKKEYVPENVEVGAMLQAQNELGQTMQVTVKEVKEDTVVLDANHPLAGKDLTFDLEVVTIL
jgi:peptidylprolyl isomerase